MGDFPILLDNWSEPLSLTEAVSWQHFIRRIHAELVAALEQRDDAYVRAAATLLVKVTSLEPSEIPRTIRERLYETLRPLEMAAPSPGSSSLSSQVGFDEQIKELKAEIAIEEKKLEKAKLELKDLEDAHAMAKLALPRDDEYIKKLQTKEVRCEENIHGLSESLFGLRSRYKSCLLTSVSQPILSTLAILPDIRKPYYSTPDSVLLCISLGQNLSMEGTMQLNNLPYPTTHISFVPQHASGGETKSLDVTLTRPGEMWVQLPIEIHYNCCMRVEWKQVKMPESGDDIAEQWASRETVSQTTHVEQTIFTGDAIFSRTGDQCAKLYVELHFDHEVVNWHIHPSCRLQRGLIPVKSL